MYVYVCTCIICVCRCIYNVHVFVYLYRHIIPPLAPAAPRVFRGAPRARGVFGFGKGCAGNSRDRRHGQFPTQACWGYFVEERHHTAVVKNWSTQP